MLDHLSVWLMPISNDWKKVVVDLSKKYAGPIFDPHVTLFSGDFSENINFDGTFSITLRADGLRFSDQFTKSCYVQFQNNDKLIKLSEKFSRGSKTKYDFNPHMSLFYGSFIELKKQSIQKEIKIPDQIEFKSIWTVTGPQTKTAADIKAWKRR